jgi:hypothetical protein
MCLFCFQLRALKKNRPVSDLIGIAVVTSVDVCGGPPIPFRSGRIDNFTPSPPGVPEPHQDLQMHTDMFKRMGFTKEEMIGLVACGHSIGGVHHSNSPGQLTAKDFDVIPDVRLWDLQILYRHLQTRASMRKAFNISIQHLMSMIIKCTSFAIWRWDTI